MRALATLGLLGLVCFLPLALDRPPVEWVAAGPAPLLQAILVCGVLFGLVVWNAWFERRAGGSLPGTYGLAVLAAGMVFVHWLLVERHPDKYAWARETYLTLLNHQGGAPHQYRLLPYGFVRLLERLTGDWWLAVVAYRWFFSYWFCRFWVRFVACFTSLRAAECSTLILVPLYPCSVAWYMGQLTDPLSHMLFVLGLLWIVEQAPLRLAGALFLGIFAKETCVILIAAYFAVWIRDGVRVWISTGFLLAVAAGAFVAARGFGWRPDFDSLNGTPGLMIGTNLGFGEPLFQTGVPLYHNYLHPLLFTLPFAPGIRRNGSQHESRLIILALVVVPAILVSSLCFSWLYESRNYLPFLPILAALALPPQTREKPTTS